MFPLSRYLGKVSCGLVFLLDEKDNSQWEVGVEVILSYCLTDTGHRHVTHVGLTHVDKPCQIESLPETISLQTVAFLRNKQIAFNDLNIGCSFN